MIHKVYGRNLLDCAFKSNVSIRSIDCTAEVFEKIQHDCKRRSIKPAIRPLAWFPSAIKHQGIMFEVDLIVHRDFSDLDLDQMKTVLVLDHLHDPQNVGSALRHAAAFGVDCVVMPLNNSAPLSEAAIQASVGGIFLMPIVQAPSFSQMIDRLAQAGFGIIGTSLAERSESFHPNVFWPKTALVIGHEGSGLSHGIEKKCDHLVKIDIAPQMQSLNAAVTAAILCFERYKALKS
ncbi:MAG: RNA methyltransferase [Gammaproteobacteria bacterium]|nr:RNA methyltransferase [Gammaproteobacteria bacterium]